MGGISLMDIVDAMATALSSDAAITAWVDEKYDATVVIMVGIDERNRPGRESCPMILIRPESQGLGQTQGELRHTIQIDWAIFDDAQTTSGVVTEYTGVRRVDEFGRLIWDALRSGISDQVAMDRSEYVLETVEHFPLLLGGMDITINVPQLIGAEITL